MGEFDARREWLKCSESCMYFVHNYCNIYDSVSSRWIPFHLWPLQARSLRDLQRERLVIILKARQLGMTWLVLSYVLWECLFQPVATSLVFSRREEEAKQLLERMRGIYMRLPRWAQAKAVMKDNATQWKLSNSSTVHGFPTTAGDSYTATIAMVDEADLVPDLGDLMTAVKPTIDAGGKMILLSRSNKALPNSAFKRIYRGAISGANTWYPIFLPWNSRPDRSPEWYTEQRNDVMARTGAVDDLWQQYPETAVQALSPNTLDKRIPPQWVEQCFIEKAEPLDIKGPDLPFLTIYEEPQPDRKYVLGADPAEGNPSSDDSSAHVLDKITGVEVACLCGKIEPSTFAEYIDILARYYNRAPLMVERNNHGHAVIAWLIEHSDLDIYAGSDGNYGWLTTTRSKAAMYANAADSFREKATRIRSPETYFQICDVEGKTLKAPKEAFDDRAVSFCLALLAVVQEVNTSFNYSYIEEGVYAT